MIQKRAVRAIFPGMSYDDILTQINVSTLKRTNYMLLVHIDTQIP